MRRGSYQAVSPAGLLIEAVTSEADHLLIVARPTAPDAACPECGLRSSQVHSRYHRRLMDLPSQGRGRPSTHPGPPVPVRFHSLSQADFRRAARRQHRASGSAAHSPAGGRRPSLGHRSRRPPRREPGPPTDAAGEQGHAAARPAPPSVGGGRIRPGHVGIDDFAWKRGQRYGTVVCDLEQRRIIDLLPDREPATVAAWLADHPEITVVSRDRGAGYGQAASKGAPQAVQVADR